mgnify:CR=1 FL=1
MVCVEKQLLFIYFDDAVDGERLFIFGISEIMKSVLFGIVK